MPAVDPEPGFQRLQRAFAAHLREPDAHAAPSEIEDRRMAVYRDLVYNNIESFVAGGFPVLRSLYRDGDWHRMVRDFVAHHAAASPYFLQIGEEFLHYLQSERKPRAGDPPFLLELAHYEWVELALDVSPETFPPGLLRDGDPLALVPVVSPLVWSLSYRYPVHRIGPDYRPSEAPETPTFLLVYRDRADEVGFMEANAVTARLLQLASAEPASGRALLRQLAAELPSMSEEAVIGFGAELFGKLLKLDVIAGYRP